MVTHECQALHIYPTRMMNVRLDKTHLQWKEAKLILSIFTSETVHGMNPARVDQ